jgi:hypothetical protein
MLYPSSLKSSGLRLEQRIRDDHMNTFRDLMIFAGVAALAGSPAFGADLTMHPQETRTVNVGQELSAIVVGDPIIADVLLEGSTLVISARNVGRTSFAALDAQGRPVLKYDITVAGRSGGEQVRLYRGAARTSYFCAPHCEPMPMPGDDSDSFESLTTQRIGSIENAEGVSSTN